MKTKETILWMLESNQMVNQANVGMVLGENISSLKLLYNILLLMKDGYKIDRHLVYNTGVSFTSYELTPC